MATTKAGGTKADKGLIRSLNRKGSKSGKGPAVAKATGTLPPSLCERCGAVFSRRTWRRDRKITDNLLARARWMVCPSCKQVEAGQYFGRVVIRGSYADEHEETIRQRILNIASRASFTQPQRRVVSISRDSGGLEVLTTSQKLAHRIVRELTKAFRGKATYNWSDNDGSLFAVWERQVR